MIYTLTVSPSIDYINKLDDFKINSINRSSFSSYKVGGKGINVSLVLKELGIKSYVLGFKADFTGEYLYKQLNEMNIQNKLIDVEGSTRINVKVIGNNEFAINTDTLIINDNHINLLMEEIKLLNDNDIIIISGNIPNCLNNNLYEEIIKKLNKNVKFIIDAEDKLILPTLKYKPFLIKPNREELEKIFNVNIKNKIEAFNYAHLLRKEGARNVIVSLDKDGAILVDENNNEYYLRNCDGKLINSVGAGDSLIAGFICGIEKGYSTKDAFILGVACGNATAFSHSLANKSSIEKMVDLLKEVNK